MRALLLSYILIFCVLSIGYSHLPLAETLNDEVISLSDDCVNVSVEILTEYGDVTSAVNVDCLDKFYYKIIFTYKEDCPATEYSSMHCFSNVNLQITIGASTIFDGTIQEGSYNEFFESFGDLDIGGVVTPSVLDIEMNLSIQCHTALPFSPTVTRSIASLSYPVTFLSSHDNSGQVYVDSYWDFTNVKPVAVECDFGLADPVCCSGEVVTISAKMEISYSIIQFGTQEYTVTPKVSLSAGPISFSIPYPASFVTSNASDFTSGFYSAQSMSLKHVPGYCVYPGFIILEDLYITEYWGVTCDPPYRKMISSSSRYIPRTIQFSDHCQMEQPTDCPPIPSESIDKGFRNGGNILASKYKGYINVNLPDYDGFRIQWSGPKDFIAHTFSINELEIGIYTYTIYNDCCESVSGHVQVSM
jgi:hypothetical protein